MASREQAKVVGRGSVAPWSVWRRPAWAWGFFAPLFKDHNEGEQLVARVMWGATIPLIVLAMTSAQERGEYLIAMTLAHGVAITAIAAWMWCKPGSQPRRRYVAMCSDATFITLFAWQAGEASSIVASLGLFITIGYGFRYGVRYMLWCAALVLAGDLSLLWHPAWRTHRELWVALPAFMLVALPYLVLFLKRADRLSAELRKSSDDKSKILSVISHNLRTPIGAIMANVELAKAERHDDLRAGYLSAARTAANILLRQIQNSLTLAIFDQGNNFTVRESVHVRDFAGDLFDLARAKAYTKGVGATLSIEPTVPERVIMASPAAQEALIALLDNAVKFTRAGHIRLDVKQTSGGQLRFEVSDSGIGIAAEDLPHVFDRFWQREKGATSASVGAGLGTSITRELVEAAGGSVGVNSILGTGSCFWFCLPFEPGPSEDPRRIVRAPAVPMRILIAEDDPAMAEVLRRMLVRAQHSVVVVVDGAQALSELTSKRFQLAIIDEHMPKMLGSEVITRLRATVAPEELPRLFVLSADTTPDAQARAYSVGADAFIQKPVEEAALLKILSMPGDPDSVRAGLPADILPIARESMKLSFERCRDELRLKNPLEAKYWVHRAKGTARLVGANTIANRLIDLGAKLSEAEGSRSVTVAVVTQIEEQFEDFMERQGKP